MERALLLDIVVGERARILKLFACENEALLIWWDAFRILDFRLHVLNRVGRLHIERNRLAGQRLHKNLHGACSFYFTQGTVLSR